MTPDLFRKLVAAASLAPSVHNTQPARWRRQGDTVVLLEDRATRLPAADPGGHDAAISLGAALEGFVIAAADAGLTVDIDYDCREEGAYTAVARLTFRDGAVPDPLGKAVPNRLSWRGAFQVPTEADRVATLDIASEDCTVLNAPEEIDELARLCDTASVGFMSDFGFRSELLSWMRLRSGDPRWAVDGLNADALHFGRVERIFAGWVLGPLFGVVRAFGLTNQVVSDAAKTRTSSAIVAFHRPEGESHLETGRAFYRAWLRFEAAGFGAAVLAALADDETAAARVKQLANLPVDHRLVSVLRIGRRPPHDPVPRARQSVDDLIV